MTHALNKPLTESPSIHNGLAASYRSTSLLRRRPIQKRLGQYKRDGYSFTPPF